MNAVTSEAVLAPPPDLHMWTADDEEWVVASSAEEARDLYCAMSGAKPESGDPNKADGGAHVGHWTPLPGDKLLARREECPKLHVKGVACTVDGCDGKGMVRHERTCAEWVALEGAGHFASTNW